MCCERLVCASCAGLVVDARCPVCRSSKAHMHVAGTSLPGAYLLAILAAALVFLLLVA